jgi:hypothetical protein
VATKSISTSFTLPTNPTWTLTASGNKAVIVLTSPVNNTYHQLLKLINGVWTVLKDNIARNATIDEYELVSGVVEQFKIRTFSSTGGYLDTTAKTLTINVQHCSIVSGDTEILCIYSPTRRAKLDTFNETVYFAGREKGVVFTGEHTQTSFEYSFEFFTESDVNTLETIIRSKSKVLIRDNKGRLNWVVIGGFQRQDANLSTIINLNNVYEVER